MLSKLFVLFTLITAVLVSADDAPYIPCKSYISFSYDDSSSINNNQFKTQMNFIKNAIASLNYPDRLRAEGGYGAEFTWNSKLSISQMVSAIDAAEQTSIPYSLLQQFSSLATGFELLNDYSNPFGAMIFISDTSDNALRNANQLFSNLKGIRLTFVLLGPNVDSSKLRNFTSNFLYWPDLSQRMPDNWDLISYHAYGCDTPYVSSTKQPMSSTTGATAAPGPCQNWITVLTDNSNKLTATQFLAQLNFTKSIMAQTTHPERIRYGSYNEINGLMQYPFDPSNTQQGLQAAIDNTNQTTSGSNVLKAIQLLAADINQNNTLPDLTLIFVTDTSNNIQIQQAVNLYNADLKPLGIKLTFILVGQNTNANALQGFDDAIIYNWQNIGFYSQPDGWDLFTALKCSLNPFSTMTPSAYIPCQSWIHFGIDDSNTLNYNDFSTQANFIAADVGSLNHPERIAVLGIYNDGISRNSGLTTSQIKMSVMSISQAGPYSLRNQFAALIINLQDTPINNIPVGALLFISDTSDAALAGASDIFSQIQNVRLTFVLLGPNVDQSKLTQFSSNFITWSDLSQPQPDNWDNLYYSAYGCHLTPEKK